MLYLMSVLFPLSVVADEDLQATLCLRASELCLPARSASMSHQALENCGNVIEIYVSETCFSPKTISNIHSTYSFAKNNLYWYLQ